MPQAVGVAVENNFKNGLITEAAGLNFPESACTETFNCEFEFDGSVTRRHGVDFEDDYTTKIIDRANNVIRTHLWKNVSGNGDLSVLVTQIGATIYFYKVSSGSLSSGAITSTVTLTPVSGAPATNTVEAQFCDGNGYLFVTHPYTEPMRVSYDTSSDTATATNLTLKIRDFEGATADVLAVDARPTATLAGLTANHKYNLLNQGWTTVNLTAWDTAQTTMPSNADVMWRFKDVNDDFDASNAAIARVTAGNTPAPKGHYILTLSNQDRDTAAGTSGVAATTTGFQRPATAAFFAGRVFYSGTNYVKFNSSIYFTQIVERDEQYGFCYQVNDPTAEDEFDLLPSDGGVIRIQDAGTIYKLFAIPGGLAVFAANGVWFIAGSTGIGFTATDYSVQKIAYIPAISATSFVDVLGFPCWWNAEGIYMLNGEGGTLPQVQSMTDLKIKSFFDEIPISSKRTARGFYHTFDKKITWIYNSTDTIQTTEIYQYDSILKYNLRTNAFYPWTISDSTVKVHSIAVTDSSAGLVTTSNVIDGSSNNVIDGSGNQLIAFIVSGSTAAPADKYLVSYLDGSNYKFTFAEFKNTDYLDWVQYDAVGVNFYSYFITGFKLRGEGLRKFGTNWVKLFSNTSTEVSYDFQSLWDFALSGNTGRWSSVQRVLHTDLNYGNSSRRLRTRGHGVVMQFKISSVPGEPFHMIGWSSMDTANQVP